MPSQGDFHTHSTFSDGRLTPTELIDLAYRNGVRIMSLTDHDIIDGLPEAFEAAAKHSDFTLVPGIEMSTDVPGGEIHILGHFIDWQDEAFQKRLRELQESRLGRAHGMVAKLAELGKPVAWERVEAFAEEGSVGRPHIALAMVEAGHVATLNEAFDLYLSRTGPAYVEREKLTPEANIDMLLRVGGLVTLAHPAEGGGMDGIEPLLAKLADAGLSAMEVYYQDYDDTTIKRLRKLADQFGLIPLGGSDYHGLGNPRQREPGIIPLPIEQVGRYLSIANERGVLDRAKGPAAAA
jgi:predicted metal-dependent phosphoesterase TrpH